eukprot:1679397-Alexandrium_andersonii.AAC.1
MNDRSASTPATNDHQARRNSLSSAGAASVSRLQIGPVPMVGESAERSSAAADPPRSLGARGEGHCTLPTPRQPASGLRRPKQRELASAWLDAACPWTDR